VIYVAVLAAGWLAAFACGLTAYRAESRNSPVQGWNLAACAACMAVAGASALEGDWFSTGLALFAAVLWGVMRSDGYRGQR
jgi:hypothetical protein